MLAFPAINDFAYLCKAAIPELVENNQRFEIHRLIFRDVQSQPKHLSAIAQSASFGGLSKSERGKIKEICRVLGGEKELAECDVGRF